MNLRKHWLAMLAAIAASMMMAKSASSQEVTSDGAADVEVQARGPVHEGFAAPVGAVPEPTSVVPKQPPEPIEEVPAEQKPDGDNMQWIPGYWAWDADHGDYMWVSGFWRAPPPGRTWIPGHWNALTGGWQWVPGIWQGAAVQEVSYLPAPPMPPVQAAPSVPAPNPDAVFAPGHWSWRGDRYVWVPGYWVNYRPGWVWVPPAYAWTPAGYVFVDGYWDYPLRERGLLFAPVVIDARVYGRPGYVYRPTFVIVDDNLYGSLFVHAGYRHYYYGDYFEPRYRTGGFVAWCDVRVGVGGHDPLFAYYRWNYRNDPGWHRDIQAVYVGRYNGTIAAPPRTIVRNVTVINNTTVINRTTVVNNRFATNAAPVQSLHSVQATMKLKPVSAEVMAHHANAAKEMRGLATQRRAQESKLVSERPAGSLAPTAARVTKLNLPTPPAGAGAAAAHGAPTTPAAHGAPPTPTAPAAHPGAPTTPAAHGTVPTPPTTHAIHPMTPTTPGVSGAPGATTPGTAPGTKPGTPAGGHPAPTRPAPRTKDKEKKPS